MDEAFTFPAMGEVLYADSIVGHFDYVVQLSMRCFAAGSKWRRTHRSMSRNVVFTSELGISRYINEIAYSYVHGPSPLSVLIEDDYLVHGSSLGTAIEDFIDELMRAIKRLGGEEGKRIRRSILRNLHARVYMATDNALLINNDVMSRIHAGSIRDAANLRRSSIAFVKYMAREVNFGSANVLCATLSGDEFKRLFADDQVGRWSSYTTVFGENSPYDKQQLFRIKSLRDDVVITLRAMNRGKNVCLIPAVHHGDMDWRHVQRLESALRSCAEHIADEVTRIAVTNMLKLVMQISNLSYRVAFADMLLGQIAVSVLTRNGSSDCGTFNTEQVAEFYGMRELLDTLDVFARIPFEWDDLNLLIKQLPGFDVQGIRQVSKAEDVLERSGQNDVLEDVRAAGYRLALSVETDLQTRQRARAYSPRDSVGFSGRWFSDIHLLNPKTYVPWTEFVNTCVSNREDSYLSSKDYSLEAVYASIYALVDNDQLSMLYAENHTPEGQSVSQVVGTTEMSLSILPSAMRRDIWEWFKDTVTYCRLNGLSIEKTMRRLGYRDDNVSDVSVLLGDAASVLEGRRYMDTAVLDWEAGVNWTYRLGM